MVAVRKRTAMIASFVACVGLLVAGCTSSTGKPGASTTSSATDPSTTSPASTTSSSTRASTTSAPPHTPTTSSSAPADPRVAAAVRAYDMFSASANYAQAHPPKKIGDALPPRGDFRPYSFDPAQGQVLSYVFSLTADSVAYRGTPPSPRTSVTFVQLNAAPYPSVILNDCPTAPADWTTYYRATGKRTGDKPGQVKPPYVVTVRMIFYKKHWGVYKLSPNATRTCTPP